MAASMPVRYGFPSHCSLKILSNRALLSGGILLRLPVCADGDDDVGCMLSLLKLLNKPLDASPWLSVP